MHQGCCGREQQHHEAGDHDHGAGAYHGHGTCDLACLARQLGLGEIELVADQLGELGEDITEKLRDRPVCSKGHGHYPRYSRCEGWVDPPAVRRPESKPVPGELFRKRTAMNPAKAARPRNAVGCRRANVWAFSIKSLKSPVLIESETFSTCVAAFRMYLPAIGRSLSNSRAARRIVSASVPMYSAPAPFCSDTVSFSLSVACEAMFLAASASSEACSFSFSPEASA